MNKKYELTNEKMEHYGETLYRIKALKDFGNVKKGDLGGFVESENNLSHCEDCWVYGSAKVFNNAVVSGNSTVSCNAEVSGNAEVYGDARVYGYAEVYGYAKIYENAIVCNNARVFGYDTISGNTVISKKDCIVEGEILEELKPSIQMGGFQMETPELNIINHSTHEVVPSHAMGETFYYCRDCKVEVDQYKLEKK